MNHSPSVESPGLRIDLNSDVGESYGAFRMGDDAQLLPLVSSANIACGFHGGDPQIMAQTVMTARDLGLAIGAHPGFQDLQGFGRRKMVLSPEEIYHLTLYQIGALSSFAKAYGTRLSHVKGHGALNTMAAENIDMARAICTAVRDVDNGLLLYAIAGSALVKAGEELGLSVIQEVFADRSYQDNGMLTPRGQPNALITHIETGVAQVLSMLEHGYVRSVSGKAVPVSAGTLCIHGDQPGAAVFAQGIRRALDERGIRVRAPGQG